ncbi:MAG: hypothetical protein COU11_03205 [Candidatus Harrisonbacteria bacterium CG10_big_fil_rev_8_21_14_0_10_49_15]|uniref:Uncharacterized protein n=1 Tax=Candidatus Harrisonbacteria bacterium CG10_big_fil_rev_8_21_14_0_10_49_15 TaxID=1974587 RepID=A0A2H0UKB4_9BACT|nr:MAG: hypothetical protein COU11_03205 [Candidatus Harrisonbacteria bacterium CG10_big_fil_rev_8_21_14_0_10_49_15]
MDLKGGIYHGEADNHDRPGDGALDVGQAVDGGRVLAAAPLVREDHGSGLQPGPAGAGSADPDQLRPRDLPSLHGCRAGR